MNDLDRRIFLAAKVAQEGTRFDIRRRWHLDYFQPEAEYYGTLRILTKQWDLRFPVFVPVMPGDPEYEEAEYTEALVDRK